MEALQAAIRLLQRAKNSIVVILMVLTLIDRDDAMEMITCIDSIVKKGATSETLAN